jgi:uncharacterized protein with HEPN domain
LKRDSRLYLDDIFDAIEKIENPWKMMAGTRDKLIHEYSV